MGTGLLDLFQGSLDGFIRMFENRFVFGNFLLELQDLGLVFLNQFFKFFHLGLFGLYLLADLFLEGLVKGFFSWSRISL